jgi:hypothetical protein
MYCVRAAAAVGPCDDLKKMTVGIVEIDTPPVVPAIDLVRLLSRGICPIAEPSFKNAVEYLIEFRLTDEECKVALRHVTFGIHKIERRFPDFHDRKVLHDLVGGQAENFG